MHRINQKHPLSLPQRASSLGAYGCVCPVINNSKSLIRIFALVCFEEFWLLPYVHLYLSDRMLSSALRGRFGVYAGGMRWLSLSPVAV